MNKASEILKENRFCVLSTSHSDIPNSSLMNYATDENVTEIYMLASNVSVKCKNIKDNPNVSMLIDTRLSESTPRALTVYGKAEIITDDESKRRYLERLLNVSPDLSVFGKDAHACIIAVRITGFLLMDGITEGGFVEV